MNKMRIVTLGLCKKCKKILEIESSAGSRNRRSFDDDDSNTDALMTATELWELYGGKCLSRWFREV